MEHKNLMAAFVSRLELEKSTTLMCLVSKRPCKKYPFKMAKEAALHLIGAWRSADDEKKMTERKIM